MSLPPALLQRLAQRGLVQKSKKKEADSTVNATAAAENEEVIAEDYDELENEEQQSAEEYQYPSQYEQSSADSTTLKKRTEDNFWVERMRARMGDAGSSVGYKSCPNKYNIWHKCTLYCVNRWAEARPEPSREYIRRHKRLRRKYPLPKGWGEMYDPGCGVFYFCSPVEGLVSWLPPTHPKSQVTKCAATLRRQLEETSRDGGGAAGSDGEQQQDDSDDEAEESGGGGGGESRHQREIDDIINTSMRTRSPQPSQVLVQQDFPSLQEGQRSALGGNGSDAATQRKQKSRDLDRTLSRQQRRDRERDRDRSGYGSRRHVRGGNTDVVDPMDPAAYSDIPRGKWSDGLHVGGTEERNKKANVAEESKRERVASERTDDRKDERSDDENDDDERDYH